MSEYDIALELARLHTLSGAEFIRHLKWLTSLKIFRPLENETDIFSTGGETSQDYESLLNAARKAVSHGYRVFILPNPSGIRTADFIFERKGVYKLFDLKTIHGTGSVDSRLSESIGQSNRVLLNIATTYRPSALARSVKRYFEKNPVAVEVLIFKGNKLISIIREDAESPIYFKQFLSKYTK